MRHSGRRIALLAAGLGVIVAGVAAVAFLEEIVDYVEAYILSKRLDVTITLEKSVLTPGETIRGTVTVVNRARERVEVDYWPFRDLRLRPHGGPAPKEFGDLSSDGILRHSRAMLLPGVPVSSTFNIPTDPLGPVPGYGCNQGTYDLGLPPLGERFALRVKVQNARLEFTAPSLGFRHRIARLSGGHERFAVQREDDSIELYDLAKGQRLALQRMPFHVPIRDSKSIAYSPDGRRLARFMDGKTLELHDLLDARSGRIPLPAGSYLDGWLLFSHDSQRVFLKSARAEEILEIDCDQGSVVSKFESKNCDHVTPDGEYLLSLRAEPTATSRSNGHVRRLKPLSADNAFYSHLVGLTGIYYVSKGGGGALLSTYDGTAERRFATKASHAVAESADGAYVAFQRIYYLTEAYVYDPIEVWDVSEAKLLFKIQGRGRDQPRFITSPTALLCGMHVTGDPDSGASWLAERFELYDIPSGRLIKTIATGLSEPAAAGSSTTTAR